MSPAIKVGDVRRRYSEGCLDPRRPNSKDAHCSDTARTRTKNQSQGIEHALSKLFLQTTRSKRQIPPPYDASIVVLCYVCISMRKLFTTETHWLQTVSSRLSSVVQASSRGLEPY
jgi:hypothetical protein